MLKEVNNSNPTKRYTSLSRGLLFWFLLMSILPLTIVSYIGYQETTKTLTKTIIEKLNQSSNQTIAFIYNWFSYRAMDIKAQAKSLNNIELLKDLIKGFNQSGKSLSEYVKSSDYTRLIEDREDDLIYFSKNYDYIYDVFLLDTKGNLLFTVAHESDLGTNMLTGPYANTLFSQSIKATLESGKLNFSDLERYSPSKNIIAGFMTVPVTDAKGNKLGVFAIQIKVEKIFSAVKQVKESVKTLNHYLVGEDGKLRTELAEGKINEVLTREINTKQYELWRNEHSETHSHNENLFDEGMHEIATVYQGPNGDTVIGQHQLVKLPGVKWALMSEVNYDEAMAPVNWMVNVMAALVVLTFVIVSYAALYLSRRISRPVIELVEASKEATRSKTFSYVNVNTNDEIAMLAEAFNRMLDVRLSHEQELEQTTAQAERAYHELAEQKFALDQHSIVAITDAQGTITFANQKFADISGYDMTELIGQNHRILNSGYHDREFFNNMYRTIGRGDVWHGEVRNKAKDGHFYWMSTTIVPFKGEDGRPKSYIAIRTDITERKKAEAELIKAKEDAEAANRQKSEFLANMSHEIRTPMNGVIGMTGLLLDTPLDSKQKSYAKSTLKSAEALLGIINDILDFSKIEAGKMELELLPFNILNLMEDVSELMSMKCQEKNIEMLLRFKPCTEKFVIGDPGRIRQILLNLLSNAIKFTEKGSVLLTVESSDIVDGQTIFSVSVTDTGIGINDDKLDTIFNKFDQEDGSTTRKYGGTGLGLAICKQLCELMQGDIKVESNKGTGSVFSFTMKLGVTEEEMVTSVYIGDVSDLKGLKTLIVDDLLIARTILSEQLADLELNIEMASSGEEALQKIKQASSNNKPYDIVITDYHMPEMDGEMLATELHEQKLLEEGILIFITAYPRKGDGKRVKDKGADGYLIKPTRSTDVIQILSLVWEAKKQGKHIPLANRHMLHEVKTGSKHTIKVHNTHVLLVEDNPVNQMVATEYLEKLGCTVSPAGNGLEAVAQYKSADFDLVFMDCQMPEMDGYEATGVICEWERFSKKTHTPIIAFTANAMQGDKDKCINAGMDDYITKPVNEKALEDILCKWLADKVIHVTIDENETRHVVHVVESTEKPEDENVLKLDVFNTLKSMFGQAFPDAIASHTKSAKDNIERIEKALETNNADELERAAHSIKGASAQFGAMALSELSFKLEQLGKAGKLEEAKTLLNELKAVQIQAEKQMLSELD